MSFSSGHFHYFGKLSEGHTDKFVTTEVQIQCSYNGFSLLQDLVVLAEGGQEDEGGDVFKTVNPLPTL